MLELIATIVLIISFLGIGVILFRKIPVLRKLPNRNSSAAFNFFSSSLGKKLLEKIKTSKYFTLPAAEIFLQKILSKIRILTLKIENKTGKWLQQLREKSQKKKVKENDNYWEKIKKSTNQKNKNLPA